MNASFSIRSRAWLYVEYADGEKEYHDLVSDPNQLRNTFAILSNDDKAALHVALDATVHCHDAKTCWAAQRAPRLSQKEMDSISRQGRAEHSPG